MCASHYIHSIHMVNTILLYINKKIHTSKVVERGRWSKPKVEYIDRLCTLCDERDIEDEYHIGLHIKKKKIYIGLHINEMFSFSRPRTMYYV